MLDEEDENANANHCRRIYSEGGQWRCLASWPEGGRCNNPLLDDKHSWCPDCLDRLALEIRARKRLARLQYYREWRKKKKLDKQQRIEKLFQSLKPQS